MSEINYLVPLWQIRDHSKLPAPRSYLDFYITADGGPDARWIARKNNGVKLRADTLAGIKKACRKFNSTYSI